MAQAAARIAVVALTALVFGAGCAGGDGNGPPAASGTLEESTASESLSDEWDLVALGDSVPTGAGDAGPQRSFPQLLAKRIAKDTGKTVNVTNLAVGGTSGDLRLAIGQNEDYREAIVGAEIVTLTIGGNDLFQADQAWMSGTCEDGKCYEKALAEFDENWQAILAQVVELRKPEEAMLRVTNSYNPLIGHKAVRQELGSRYEELSELSAKHANKLNSLICDTATREGILCADIYTVFNGSSGRDDPHAKGLIQRGRGPSVRQGPSLDRRDDRRARLFAPPVGAPPALARTIARRLPAQIRNRLPFSISAHARNAVCVVGEKPASSQATQHARLQGF